MKALVLATLFSATGAGAQDWPNKPIRWVVPYPPGGSVDTTSRLTHPRIALRPRRHPLPASAAADRRRPRPDDCDRDARRRRRGGRHGRSRAFGARRLHLPSYALVAYDQSSSLSAEL